MSLDDLRRTLDNQPEQQEVEVDIFAFDDGEEERHFLGMTAVERMFLSLFLFLTVTALGLALLLATGRLVF